MDLLLPLKTHFGDDAFRTLQREIVKDALAGRDDTLQASAIAATFLNSTLGGAIEGLVDTTQRAEHPDYEPDLNLKKAKVEVTDEQQSLI